MGNDLFLSKIESNDEILEGNAVDSFVYYTTAYRKQIDKYFMLKDVLDSIFTIDFLLAYYKNNEEKRKLIYHLRKDIEEKTENAQNAKDILKNLDPTTECKISIIIEYLLRLFEKKNSGLAVINGKVYFYNGCYWEIMEDDFVKHFLSFVAEKSGLPHFQVTKVRFMEALFKQLLSSSVSPVPEKTKEVKINLQNGTFVCNDGSFEIRSFSPDDMLTYQLPFDYNPNAKAEKFTEFLEYVVPEKEARMVIAEYIAYVFAKHLRWEKCMVLYGSGCNGKSVLIDVISALLGKQNVCNIPLGRLCEANGYYRAEMGNYLLNACSEMGSKDSDPEMVKQLFSNDPVSARSPYGKPITVSNYCRFLFSTNYISNKDMEQTNGFFRRFLFVMFEVTIPEWKKNPNLAKEIIEDELSGVFNWVLEGLQRILEPGRQGFTYSAQIDKANRDFERNSNSVALFMSEKYLQPSSTKHRDAKDLYNEYKFFCEENRYGAVSKQEFLRRLETQLKYFIKRKATNNATWVYCEEIKNTEKEDNTLVGKLEAEGIINSNKRKYL
ncbi:phage/plasmid primase, P4 family [uncultured Bacteroides sp.]|uniref:DNA primase family protein n=1 Tax=uncultured Bacteroides sp. TaxID=162156 RepID=UPI00262DCF82|nr:phage/plasmid primase, P4 family [uncultured Bacteroides sp.]